MIDLRGVWLPQIIGFAELVADESALRLSWIEKDRSLTPIPDYDEFFEEVFGDLDSEEQLKLAENEFRDDPALIGLVKRFIGQVLEFDRELSRDPNLKDARALFESPEWREARVASARLVGYAAGRGYSTQLSMD